MDFRSRPSRPLPRTPTPLRTHQARRPPSSAWSQLPGNFSSYPSPSHVRGLRNPEITKQPSPKVHSKPTRRRPPEANSRKLWAHPRRPAACIPQSLPNRPLHQKLPTAVDPKRNEFQSWISDGKINRGIGVLRSSSLTLGAVAVRNLCDRVQTRTTRQHSHLGGCSMAQPTRKGP